jgi:DNA-binding transcriptional MerR regulator
MEVGRIVVAVTSRGQAGAAPKKELSVEYRIDELARAAGLTVRNVRVYQDRGLLPPPRRQGRVGIYDDAHLARLRLIRGLLERGYGFSHIAELISAWERGRNLGDLLGLEAALTGPWSDEIPDYLTVDEIDRMYAGQTTPETTQRAIAAGLLEPAGDRFRVPSPRLLHAGAELVAAGIPLPVVLDIAEQLQQDVDHSAALLVQAVATHLLAGRADDWLPNDEELPQLAEVISRLRPLAQMAVDAYLAKAMEAQIRNLLGERFLRLLEGAQGGDSTASAS